MGRPEAGPVLCTSKAYISSEQKRFLLLLCKSLRSDGRVRSPAGRPGHTHRQRGQLWAGGRWAPGQAAGTVSLPHQCPWCLCRVP